VAPTFNIDHEVGNAFGPELTSLLQGPQTIKKSLDWYQVTTLDIGTFFLNVCIMNRERACCNPSLISNSFNGNQNKPGIGRN